MWKEKLPLWIKSNIGLCLGGIVGLLIFIFGFPKLLALIFFIVIGMFVGYVIQKNGSSIKENLKSFIDKI